MNSEPAIVTAEKIAALGNEFTGDTDAEAQPTLEAAWNAGVR